MKNGFTPAADSVTSGSRSFGSEQSARNVGGDLQGAQGPQLLKSLPPLKLPSMYRFLAGFFCFTGKDSFLLICLANIFWPVFRDDYENCVEKPDVVPRVALEVARRPQGWADGVQGWARRVLD